MSPMITDPIERIVAAALDAACIAYVHETEDKTHCRSLDFRIAGTDTYIECKAYATPRSADQLTRAADVILIQGRGAAEIFARMICVGVSGCAHT